VNDDDEAAALAYQEQCEAQQFFNEVRKVEKLDDDTPTAKTKIHEIRVFRRC